jgi:hypothetical protein
MKPGYYWVTYRMPGKLHGKRMIAEVVQGTNSLHVKLVGQVERFDLGDFEGYGSGPLEDPQSPSESKG